MIQACEARSEEIICDVYLALEIVLYTTKALVKRASQNSYR